MQVCEPCELEEAEPPASSPRAKARPTRGMSRRCMAGGKASKKGVRYHEDKDGERTYWRCDDGRQRFPVCICKDEASAD